MSVKGEGESKSTKASANDGDPGCGCCCHAVLVKGDYSWSMLVNLVVIRCVLERKRFDDVLADNCRRLRLAIIL